MARRERPAETPGTRGPPERDETARSALERVLRRGPATARDLSEDAGLREKDVPEHLEHLQRSLERRGERLVVEPATCIACGYAFVERKRLTRPGACPRCRSTRIDPPVFRIP
jgi:transcriptional regulator